MNNLIASSERSVCNMGSHISETCWPVRERREVFIANGKAKGKTVDEIINEVFVRVGTEFMG